LNSGGDIVLNVSPKTHVVNLKIEDLMEKKKFPTSPGSKKDQGIYLP
jgi:hypothetical protein